MATSNLGSPSSTNSSPDTTIRDGRITVGFAPHSPYDLTPDQVARIARQAQDVGALLHIHLEETEAERQLVIDRHGCTATQLLADHGVLEGPVIAAHGVWLDATDQRLLAEASASVAHCPVSNLKLGSGIAPVVDFLEAGLNVALGTDGVASNDNLDLWEELKLAPLLARGTRHDPAAMDAVTALRLATTRRSPSRAVGRRRRTAAGSVGRCDSHRSRSAGVHPRRGSARRTWSSPDLRRHVTDVWVAGERVVQHRASTRVDLDEAVAQCRVRGRRLANAGLAR